MQRLLVRFGRRKSWTGQGIALAFEFWRFFSGLYVQLRRHYSPHHWSSKETSRHRKHDASLSLSGSLCHACARRVMPEKCVGRLQLQGKPCMPSNACCCFGSVWDVWDGCCFLLGKGWSHPKWLAFSGGFFQSLILVTTFWNWLGLAAGTYCILPSSVCTRY